MKDEINATNDTNNCPHCGAKKMLHSFVCGTTLPNFVGNCIVSDLCREREAHQRTMGENHILRDIAARALAITKTWNVDYEEVEKLEDTLDEIQKLKEA